MRVLKHRDFALLWWGQLVSQLGNQFNYIALAWLMWVTTGSSTIMGGVYLAQILPNALLGWVVGVLTDRLDRRRLMIALDWGRGALVLLLPLAYHQGFLNLWLVYAVTFAVSTLTLMFYSAEKTVIPALVPEEDLTEANALVEMTGQGANLAGPVLAGMAVAILPSAVDVLYLDAGTFVLSAFFLWGMRWRDPRQARTSARPSELVQEAVEGVKFLFGGSFLRVVFLTATAANFLVMPFAVIFPILSDKVLLSGSQGFGWLMGGLGGGMLLGSLLAAPLEKRFSAVTIIFGGMALLGVSFATMSVAPTLPLAVALAFSGGLGVSPANAIVITLVQRITPEAMQGRVFASLFAVVGMAAPLGVALASHLLGQVGAQRVLLMVGSATIVVAVVGAYLAREGPPTVARSNSSGQRDSNRE